MVNAIRSEVPGQGAPQGGGGRSSATGGTGGTGSSGSSALEKALRVTEALTAFGGPHRLAELSAAAGVPKSSTYRILVSLVEQGYAVTDGDGSYGVGLRLRTLAAEISTDRPEGIVELLEFLQKCTGQSVHLALRSGNALTGRAGAPAGQRPGRPAPRPVRARTAAAVVPLLATAAAVPPVHPAGPPWPAAPVVRTAVRPGSPDSPVFPGRTRL